MIRLLVADDHPAVRTGLVALLRLEPGLIPVATAANGAQAVEQARAHQPDVALVDYHLPDDDGLRLCRKLRSLPQPPSVVIYSAFADERLALPAALLGAHAVVSKGAHADDLFEVVRSAAAGTNGLHAGPSLLAAAEDVVSLDDLPVLGMLADRTPAGQIAEVLGISRAEVDRKIDRMVELLKRDIDESLPPPSQADAVHASGGS